MNKLIIKGFEFIIPPNGLTGWITPRMGPNERARYNPYSLLYENMVVLAEGIIFFDKSDILLLEQIIPFNDTVLFDVVMRSGILDDELMDRYMGMIKGMKSGSNYLLHSFDTLVMENARSLSNEWIMDHIGNIGDFKSIYKRYPNKEWSDALRLIGESDGV